MNVDTESPNGLEGQGRIPWLKTLSKKRIILGCCLVGTGLFLALYFGIMREPNAGGQTQAQSPPKADTKSIMPNNEGTRGGMIAVPVPEDIPEKPQTLPLQQAQTPARPLDPRLEQELQQLRQYKQGLALQALQSPLLVPVAYSGGQASSPRQGAGDAGQSQGQNTRTGAAFSTDTGNQGDYNPQAQKDKEGFAQRSHSKDAWSLANSRTAGAFCEIKTGSVIPAIMISGINSDLPGQLIAQVSQNVYDSATGKLLLLPQGSRLFGVYDSRIAMGQERVLIAWNRVIFPDGSSVDLGSMPGADQGGLAGFTDKTDNHWFRIFGSSFLMSMITGGMAYSMDALQPNSNSNSNNQKPTVQQEMGTALAGQMGQASLQLLQKNVNIQPTLEVRSGYRFNIVVLKDIIFDEPYTHTR